MAERGTPVVLRLLQQPNAKFSTSALTPLELRSAVSRLVSTGQISQAIADRAIQQMEAELTSFTLLDISPALLLIARRLVERDRLRTLDALQCATAVLAQQAAAPGDSVVFVAADRKLLVAAQANGLDVLNPEEADLRS